MNDKQVEDFIDKLNKQAAKHLVKLGVGKDWKKIYEGMKKRRKKRKNNLIGFLKYIACLVNGLCLITSLIYLVMTR
jgi:hypothetical protein